MSKRKGKGGYAPKFLSVDQLGVFGEGKAGLPSISVKGLLQMIKPSIGLLTKAPSIATGSGPYTVTCSTIRTLPKHTIYQPDPSTIPINSTIPVILWGNGACAGWGGCFSKFLVEVASHGYFIIANGIPQFKGFFSQTNWTDMMQSMDWVTEYCGIGEYRHIDKSRLAVAGQSCGGLQAYTASLDERVTLTCIFNSGLLVPENVVLFEKLHAPIGYFLGGPTDMAFKNVKPPKSEEIVSLLILHRENETTQTSPHTSQR